MVKTKGKPEELDIIIGESLKRARLERGWSQEKLAGEIGLTFQQIQKYEKGQNRVSASRLARLSVILGVPLDYFFPEDFQSNASNYIKDLEEKLNQASDRLNIIRNISTREKLNLKGIRDIL